MQTNLADFIRDTPQGQEADRILRACVHCGFCNATCPTYQLLGDELDGPRGRIYQIKSVLEGAAVTEETRDHLDRCLTCRSCESTCPSGVQYGRLVDIGREVVEAKVPRSAPQRLIRWALRRVLPKPALFGFLLGLGRLFRPLLPKLLKDAVPLPRPAGSWPAARHARRLVIAGGCVQPALAPDIDSAYQNAVVGYSQHGSRSNTAPKRIDLADSASRRRCQSMTAHFSMNSIQMMTYPRTAFPR